MAKRDYKAEYRKRIERGLARGLSRSQARGHPRASERAAKSKPVRADEKINAAVLEMNHRSSLTAAAKSHHISPERLRRFVAQEGIAERSGHRWAMHDDRPRRLPVMTGGDVRILIVAGYSEARLVGEHWEAASEFVRTNEIASLKPFVGRSVRAARGRKYPLETDPNAIHRITAMGTPPFHEIYDIVSPS